MIESVLMFLLGGFLMAIGTNAAVNWFVTPLPKVWGHVRRAVGGTVTWILSIAFWPMGP
jgi:hypothetical protein